MLGEKLIGQQQGLNLGAELGQEAAGAGRASLAEKDRPEPQAAANGFFQNSQTFNGAIPVGSEFPAIEGPAQLFDQGIMASLDAAQAGIDAPRFGCACPSCFTRPVRIIPVPLGL